MIVLHYLFNDGTAFTLHFTNYSRLKTWWSYEHGDKLLTQWWKQFLYRPCDFQEIVAPVFPENRPLKAERLPALHTCHHYHQINIPAHFCLRLHRDQGHCAAWRVRSMKNFSDRVGNQPSTCLSVKQCLNKRQHHCVVSCRFHPFYRPRKPLGRVEF
jgi:hypothetical protein